MLVFFYVKFSKKGNEAMQWQMTYLYDLIRKYEKNFLEMTGIEFN